MNLYSLPPQADFLGSIAATWLARCDGDDPSVVSRGLILLPTRRAARSLAEAFLRASGGRSLLLPRITALGALDEAPLAMSGALDLPPAIEDAPRLAALSRMILAMDGANGAPRTADRAWRLASELAALMDEAELEGVDLARRLPDAVASDYAEHWQKTLEFLSIVTRAWPDYLAAQGLMNPAARRVALLDAQAEAWRRAPPADPVLIAGTTGGIPAVATLLGVVCRLGQGEVVLPGLDLDMCDEDWDGLSDAHPQSDLRGLLAALGVTRGDVRPWPSPVQDVRIPPARVATIRSALLPASALEAWRHPFPVTTEGLSRLHAADQQEEATAIALILRNAIETPAQRAALVTPDRGLAGRVTAELGRHGVAADDSAGEPLMETPPAVFLRLLLRAVADELAPVPLLALLKHPLAAAGLAPAACRAAARSLELLCLRGPRPLPGLGGLRRVVAKAPASEQHPTVEDLLGRIERCLEPALRVAASPVAPDLVATPAEAMAAAIEAAERLATTDVTPGADRLGAGDDGRALAERLASVLAALPMLPDQVRPSLPGLLDAVLEGQVVRSRRALRGRDGREHPRVFIWGLLEARLQSADLIVLGGLAETVWPPAVEPGPWMSRPMRQRIGLPSPEQRIGQTAHDFVSAACAAPEVILSCPRRRDGAPAVPSRWLERLTVFLASQRCSLEAHPAAGWVRLLDQPAGGKPAPVAPPRPCPPLRLRPRRLRVTEVETWVRDPYAIYARHVLGLRTLDPLEQSADASDYGSIVHDGINRFLHQSAGSWPPDAADLLREALERSLAEAGLRGALAAWWRPRLGRIAAWVARLEAERRKVRDPVGIASEASGHWVFDQPGGRFTVVGRADRLERHGDGSVGILDYKTGTVPGQASVEAMMAPQLPLEARMVAEGAFGAEWQGPVSEMAYWRLTGKFESGKASPLYGGDAARIAAAADAARTVLVQRIDHFDDAASCYLSHPVPQLAPRFPEYRQLARVTEWTAAGECRFGEDGE